MNLHHLNTAWKSAALLALILCLAACNGSPSTPIPSASPTGTEIPVGDTPTIPPTEPPPPSPTPLPLAALVNGEGITLAEYEAELARYQASGTNLATNAEQAVLDELISQVLLAQAAAENGFTVDETLLDARLEALTEEMGEQALADWMAANGYDEAAFRTALGRSIAAAWMRDQITAAVPETAEQAHVRQILLYNLDQANEVYSALEYGQDFTALAAQYDPLTGGDLGWFPRGYLTEPSVEEAAFALEPGTYSTVIETRLGYHIVQLIEREMDRPLLPEARQALQLQALHLWLDEQRSQSEIQIMLP